MSGGTTKFSGFCETIKYDKTYIVQPDAPMPYNDVDYYYDDNNRVMSIEYFWTDFDGNRELQFIVNYTYDSEGNLTNMKIT